MKNDVSLTTCNLYRKHSGNTRRMLFIEGSCVKVINIRIFEIHSNFPHSNTQFKKKMFLLLSQRERKGREKQMWEKYPSASSCTPAPALLPPIEDCAHNPSMPGPKLQPQCRASFPCSCTCFPSHCIKSFSLESMRVIPFRIKNVCCSLLNTLFSFYILDSVDVVNTKWLGNFQRNNQDRSLLGN